MNLFFRSFTCPAIRWGGFLLGVLLLRSGLADELEVLQDCTLVQTEWADGDSFLVQDAKGNQYTFRLYYVDCLEYHVTDKSDARRLRAQRRYFGISQLGGSAATSIAAAKEFGKKATEFVQKELEKPFTVYTSWADGRGDGKHKRYYAFIKTSGGEDLGEKLVRVGLARAFGVGRSTPNGESRDEHRRWLADIELLAAKKGVGIWAATDWNALPNERRQARQEDAELELATRGSRLAPGVMINVNSAARDELMKIPGIGEVLANRIIEGRVYATIDALGEVEGIGAKKLEQIRPYLKLID